MVGDEPEADHYLSRWPQDADRLFVTSVRPRGAQLVRDPGERFYRMPMGYKRAGDILVDQAATDVAELPNVIYAALFCYRQSIELFLKGLIEEFDHGSNCSPELTHDLDKLWRRFMCIVDERGGHESIGLKAAQRLVAEMNEADQKSDAFRFPTDSKRAPFPHGDREIDLANLREVVQGLVNFFECASLEFSRQGGTISSDE